MKFEKFAVDARFVVKTLKVRFGDELDEVAIAHLIHGEEDEATPAIVDTRLHVFPRACRNEEIYADDWLDIRFLACLIELDSAVEIAAVSERKRLHAESLGFANEVVNLGQC